MNKIAKKKSKSSSDKTEKEKISKHIEPELNLPFHDVEKLKKKRKRENPSESPIKKLKKNSIEADELEIDILAPTPPSKKALRQQKKGKVTSITDKSPNEPIDTTHPDRKNLVKEIPRAEYSVWIGNLSYASDVKALRGWLVRGNNRVSDKEITRINLPLNADGQSKGFPRASGRADVDLRMWIF